MSSDKGNALLKIYETMRLFPDPVSIDKKVTKLKASHHDWQPKDLAKKTVNAMTWKMTGLGVAASLPGMIPVFGTAAQIAVDVGVALPETYLLLKSFAHMQWTVAGIYGHDLYDYQRKVETMIIWGLTVCVLQPTKKAAAAIGSKIAVKQFSKRVSGKIFAKINAKIGTTVLTKFGVKRGGVAIGRLIPFGVGAVIGGGINLASTKLFGNRCLKFYGEILPGGEDLYLVKG